MDIKKLLCPVRSSKNTDKDTKKESLRFSFAETFAWERLFCRLIAAWLTFTAYNLQEGDKFFEIKYAQDAPLSELFLWCALIFVCLSAIKFFMRDYETDTWVLMISATSCVVKWIISFSPHSSNIMFVFAVIAIYGLLTAYFIHKNGKLWEYFSSLRMKGLGVISLCALFGILSFAVISYITCMRYKTFSSPTFDFGIWVNMFHHMKETGLPLVTCERNVLLSHFAVHLSPIYYVILPFYSLFPTPLTLQIAQAAAIASGVIPLVLLCRHLGVSGKSTILVSFIYCFFPALTTGCLYDLHENCFLAPLLLWLFYFFEKEKYLPMYIFAFATFMVKEDAAIYVLVFAVYLIISRKKFLHGGILAALSVAYFFIALGYLESTAEYYAEIYADKFTNPPIDGPMLNRFDNLMVDPEEGLLGVLKTLILNPGFFLTQLLTTTGSGWDKLLYVIHMFLPLGFIPFCTKKPSRYLLIAPILINLLTQYIYQYNIGFQYHFGIIAFLIYVTVLNIKDTGSHVKKTLLGVGAVACACIYLFFSYPQVLTYAKAWAEREETFTKMEEILDTIPEDASVVCTYSLLAHVADRDEVYDIDYHGDVINTDYVIFDTRYGYNQEKYQSILDQGYTVKEEHPGLMIILEKAK